MKGNDCLASVFDTEKNEALADSSDVRLSISMETKYLYCPWTKAEILKEKYFNCVMIVYFWI